MPGGGEFGKNPWPGGGEFGQKFWPGGTQSPGVPGGGMWGNELNGALEIVFVGYRYSQALIFEGTYFCDCPKFAGICSCRIAKIRNASIILRKNYLGSY